MHVVGCHIVVTCAQESEGRITLNHVLDVQPLETEVQEFDQKVWARAPPKPSDATVAFGDAHPGLTRALARSHASGQIDTLVKEIGTARDKRMFMLSFAEDPCVPAHRARCDYSANSCL